MSRRFEIEVGQAPGAFLGWEASFIAVDGSEAGFTGIVLGLSRADVEWVVQARMVPARIVAFSPLSTLVLGLSREKTLKRSDLSIRHASPWTPVLLAVWAVAAVAFFLAVASFLRSGLSEYRVAFVLLTILLGILAIMVTGLRPASGRGRHPGLETGPPGTMYRGSRTSRSTPPSPLPKSRWSSWPLPSFLSLARSSSFSSGSRPCSWSSAS